MRRWTAAVAHLVLLPLAGWSTVLSAAPQFREYALDAIVAWVGVTLVGWTIKAHGGQVSLAGDSTSKFDGYARQSPPSRPAVAQAVQAERLAALAGDAGVIERDIMPLLRAVAAEPIAAVPADREGVQALVDAIAVGAVAPVPA